MSPSLFIEPLGLYCLFLGSLGFFSICLFFSHVYFLFFWFPELLRFPCMDWFMPPTVRATSSTRMVMASHLFCNLLMLALAESMPLQILRIRTSTDIHNISITNKQIFSIVTISYTPMEVMSLFRQLRPMQHPCQSWVSHHRCSRSAFPWFQQQDVSSLCKQEGLEFHHRPAATNPC